MDARRKKIDAALVILINQLDQKRVPIDTINSPDTITTENTSTTEVTSAVRPLTIEERRSIVLNAQKLNAERFLKDNERIWSVSTLFIPLSLAGLSSLKDKSLFVVILLALASIALITFWYLASEKLRRFQDENIDAVKVYNLYLGIDTDGFDLKISIDKPEKKRKNLILNWHKSFMNLLSNTSIQTARLYMYQFVVILWLLVVAGTITENLLPQSQEIKHRIIPFFHTTFNFSLFK